MERVTDEWLQKVSAAAGVSSPYKDGYRRAFAQSIARECVRLIPGGSVCDPQVIADEIRARFGLED